jgi:hypothetical protein
MAEEKPLFLIDIDRAIEGLLSSSPVNGDAGSARVQSLVMYSVDLANALDGAGLDALSGFANALSESFIANRPQAFLLITELITLVNAEAALIHPSSSSQAPVNLERLNQAKADFEKKLNQLKEGVPISTEPLSIATPPSDVTVEQVEPQPRKQPRLMKMNTSTNFRTRNFLRRSRSACVHLKSPRSLNLKLKLKQQYPNLQKMSKQTLSRAAMRTMLPMISIGFLRHGKIRHPPSCQNQKHFQSPRA